METKEKGLGANTDEDGTSQHGRNIWSECKEEEEEEESWAWWEPEYLEYGKEKRFINTLILVEDFVFRTF